MSKPTIRIYTDIDIFIDREMDDAEFAQYEADLAKREIEKAKAEEEASAKQALLERLGITEEEAKLLLA